jgi:hypothetical protein
LSRPAPTGTLAGALTPDPLEDARALLILARLLYRARRSDARHGVIPAPARVQALLPLGRRLSEAVLAAERTPLESAERRAALEHIDRLGRELWAMIDDRSEGIRSLLSVALAGVRGDREEHPRVPEGLGHRW